ncbi:MAG TPA: HAMP domain-containing sensor histidine kinase [Gemmatimonadaceae bacterium]|nr:HAMP domain-containing sensor histidine kinase [Gemmatimonadaceae bacterium]
MASDASAGGAHAPGGGGVGAGIPARDVDERAASVGASLERALDRAVRAAQGPEDAAATPAAPRTAEYTEGLRILGDAVRTAMADRAPVVAGIPPSIPVFQMLGRLRTALLDEAAMLDPSTGAAALIRALRAFDVVQQALEQDVAHRFAGRLAGPDGLELIIEVAHDLRSPLSSILFLADTLRKGQSGTLNSVQERQLGLMYSAAFGLSAMASDVIELARGGDRLLDLHPVPFSVSGLLRSVSDIVQPMAEEKGLEVRLTPPEADNRLGHPSALNRVLLNLTTNALKFTAHGTVEVTAKQLSRTRVEFSVRDSGRGIPDDLLSTLFEPFRRRRTPTEYTFSSAGLGLSICRKLVAAMGDELRVETELDVGTRFHFELELPLAARM